MHLNVLLLSGDVLPHLLQFLLPFVVLGRGQAQGQAAAAALGAHDDELENGQEEHHAVLALVGHPLVVPLVVALIRARRLVEAADARIGVQHAAEEKADAHGVTAPEKAVADGANEAWPEPEGTDSQEDEVAGHDQGPRCIPGVDEGPSGASLPALPVSAAVVKLLFVQRYKIVLRDSCNLVRSAHEGQSFIEVRTGVVQAQDIKSRVLTAIVCVNDRIFRLSLHCILPICEYFRVTFELSISLQHAKAVPILLEFTQVQLLENL